MPDDNALLEQAGRMIHLPVTKERFRVFVFGPALSASEEVEAPTAPASDRDGLQQHARYLRYITVRKLREAGWTVDLGESTCVRKFWSALGIKNLGAMELSHGGRLCGAIIMFPTSVGSISELGMFVGFGGLAKKTLAIVHTEFKEQSSFFRLGLLKMLKIQQGSFEFEDYANAEKCIALACEYVDDKWTKLHLDEQQIEQARVLALERTGGPFGAAQTTD
jgi:hypothetical protein